MNPGGAALELWGGIECTINRVGDRFFRQIKEDGRGLRIEDLDRIAGLGIRTLRFPVLWEQFEPVKGCEIDWSWADVRLERLRTLGIAPIVGLLHHGSGPSFTSLTDPLFPEQLARYARKVAERYPWVTAFTPVNEPLTTARFSGLYGYWYPHGRDGQTFVRALLSEVRATGLAMREIRDVIPAAKLVQTEDLGEIFSTPRLRYQADFENTRRWLSLDLLAGHVSAEHPMWAYLRDNGMTDAERELFVRETCPPDIVGVNHYLTSDRYLDEDLSQYPASCHGGNEREAYADTEAVRGRREGISCQGELLRAAWARYGLPVVVTEAHLACTREEQMRWFIEVWDAAVDLRDEGIDVRAVTAWSIYGARDWGTLLTTENGLYEPGVFDLRSEPPRTTALARMLTHLAENGRYEHPLLASAGWWRRSVRLAPELASSAESAARTELRNAFNPMTCSRRQNMGNKLLLITGGEGSLGKAFARLCFLRGIPYRLLSRRDFRPGCPADGTKLLDAFDPWAVVHAARWSADTAKREEGVKWLPSLLALERLAAGCASRGVALLAFSSDEVFGQGGGGEAFNEFDDPCPISSLGRMLAAGDRLLAEVNPATLVVRTGPEFGPWDANDFAAHALATLRRGRSTAVGGETVSPSYLPDVVNLSLDLLVDGESGPWHLANVGAVTWAEWAQAIARLQSLDESLISAVLGQPCSRALISAKGGLTTRLEEALNRWSAETSAAGTSLAKGHLGGAKRR